MSVRVDQSKITLSDLVSRQLDNIAVTLCCIFESSTKLLKAGDFVFRLDSDYFFYQSIVNTVLHTILHYTTLQLNTYKKNPYSPWRFADESENHYGV